MSMKAHDHRSGSVSLPRFSCKCAVSPVQLWGGLQHIDSKYFHQGVRKEVCGSRSFNGFRQPNNPQIVSSATPLQIGDISCTREGCFTTMIGRLAVLALLSTVYLIQTAEVPQQVSLTLAELGGNVTFKCPVSETEDKLFHWFKQPLGYMVQIVASVVYNEQTLSLQFNNSRFKVIKEKSQYFLTIRNIIKEDEAIYFCFKGTAYENSFFKGIFLAVKDRNQQKSFYVKQSPDTESVQPGGSVTLQCSLLSKNKENRVQCPGEHNVYWFRSGSGESHPGFIYTHNDTQKERSCDYSLSRTIQNSSDTGTYYCAVATCGEILFGEGTKVETRFQEWDPVIIILGILLALCVIVIAVLIFSRN